MVSNFVIFYGVCVCVCVSHPFSLFSLFYSGCLYYLPAGFLKREQAGAELVSGEVGMIGKKGEGANQNHNLLFEKQLFSIKK